MTAARFPARSRARSLPVAVGLLAFAVRLAYVLATRHGFRLYGDPIDFDRCAWSLASGHGYCTSLIAAPSAPSAFRPPGYPFAIAAVYAVAGHSLLAARLLAAGLGSLTAGLVAVLAARLAPARRGFALAAGCLTAVAPPLIALSGALLSEDLFIVLALLVTLALLRLDRRDAPPWLLASLGGLCGLAALTRTVGALLVLAALAAALRPAPRAEPRERRRAATVRVAAVLAGLVLVLTPWTVRNALVLHAFVPITTQGGYTLVSSYNDANITADMPAVQREPNALPEFSRLLHRADVPEATLDARERSEAVRVLAGHPWFTVRVTELHLRTMSYLLPTPVLGAIAADELAATGIVRRLLGASTLTLELLALLALLALLTLLARGAGAGRRRPRLPPWPVLAVPLLLLAGVAPLLGSPRYFIPVDPYLCLAAAGLVLVVGRRPASHRPLVTPACQSHVRVSQPDAPAPETDAEGANTSGPPTD